MYDPSFAVSRNKDSTLIVTLKTEIGGLDIYYSFDETFPDNFYPAYSSPLIVPKDANNLIVVSYRDGKQVGKMIKMPITELLKRVK